MATATAARSRFTPCIHFLHRACAPFLAVALLMASFALAAPSPVRAASLTVTNCLDNGSAGSLRQVLGGAVSGDTLTFAQDCNSGAAPNTGIKLTSTLAPGVSVTIDGTGHNVTISGGNTVQLFVLNGGTSRVLSLTGLTLANGNSSGGGAVENLGTLRVTRCTFRNNAAPNGNGGAIFNFGNTTVTSSTFTSNASSGADINGTNSGGEIFNSLGTVNVTGSAFSYNSGEYGGAIYSGAGTMKVTNSSFYANTASGNGGAIDNGATMKVTGSTFSGNASAHGGGIYNETDGSITLGLSVIANNSAPTGPDLNLTFGDFGGNVVSRIDGSSGIADGTNNNRAGTVAAPLDAKIAPFGSYGGPTATFALRPGSPAIDRRACPTDPITNATLTTDARGATRPQGAGCDSGSYEAFASPQSFVVNRAADDVNDANCNPVATGGCTLRQAVNQSNLTVGSGTNMLTFDATIFAAAQTITLTSILTPGVNVTVDGTGHRVTISGGSNTQLFVVNNGLTLSLKALTLANGNASPGSGFYYGGAIFNNGGTVQVTGSTFINNGAPFGGAIANNNGTTKVTGSTFTGNGAANGGAIYNNNGTFILALSVVAGNTASSSAPDLAGTITTGGGNVVGKTDGASGIIDGSNNDRAGIIAAPLDAKLSSLADYGGPTPTFALFPGSPAIDRAPCPIDPITTTTLVTDGRGVSRPQPVGGNCDSGSFESQGFTFSAPTGSGQSAVVTTNFATPLSVSVASGHTEPVSGGTVTFTISPGATFPAPGSTGCTISSNYLVALCPINGSGVATAPTVKAGLNVGSVTVIASATGTPVAGNVTFSLTITAPPPMAPSRPGPAPSGGPPSPEPPLRPSVPPVTVATPDPQPTVRP